jgi:hypothetical protein
MADLITLSDLKTALGGDATAYSDAQLTSAIQDASAIVRDYTGRNFGAADAPATITYRYDGSGWLTIDDASVITQVQLDGQTLTENIEYIIGPDRGFLTYDEQESAVYEWIELPQFRQIDPEMGFMYNLDTLWWKARPVHFVTVTGTFGWQTVPLPVKRATVLVIRSILDDKRQVVSEQIDSYSQTYSAQDTEAISVKAKSLLDPYRKF